VIFLVPASLLPPLPLELARLPHAIAGSYSSISTLRMLETIRAERQHRMRLEGQIKHRVFLCYRASTEALPDDVRVNDCKHFNGLMCHYTYRRVLIGLAKSDIPSFCVAYDGPTSALRRPNEVDLSTARFSVTRRTLAQSGSQSSKSAFDAPDIDLRFPVAYCAALMTAPQEV
jgi:hypothetical protein